MTWPTSQDYNEAIQNPTSSFSDPELRQGKVVCNPMGLPLPCSGNFADVYAFQTPQRQWAVKCFTRQIPGLRERYVQVSKYLSQLQLPFMVEFKFLEEGLRIRGQWYPVLKMHWVEGIALNAFVRQQLDKPPVLHTLCQIWVKMASRLREARLGHCDLQHGNVLLVPGGKAGSLAVRLVDYDGMCVPALDLLKSIELGHPNYQHPQRLREGTYGVAADRFSHLVICTALRALAVGGKALWDRHDNGDNLLFKESDLRAPAASDLFRELKGMSDPLVGMLAGRLAQACEQKLEEAPLLEELLAEEKPAARAATRPAVAVTAAPGSGAPEWDFANEPAPPQALHKRARESGRGKVPVWGWVVGGMAALLLMVGGIALALGTGGDTPEGPAVAQNRPKTPPADAGKKLDKQPPKERAKLPPKDGSKPPPKERPKLPPKEETRPLPRETPQPPSPMDTEKVGPAVPEPVAPSDTVLPHPGWLVGIAISGDGRRLLAADGSPLVTLWDLAKRKKERTFKLMVPNRRMVFTADGRHMLCVPFDGKLQQVDLATGTVVRQLGPAPRATFVTLSPDGTRALTGGGGLQNKDGRLMPVNCEVYLWDVKQGRRLAAWEGHTHSVLDARFSPDGRRVVSCGREGIWTWEVEGGKLLKNIRIPNVTTACVSGDGRHVAVAAINNPLRIWDAVTGEMVQKFDERPGQVMCLKFTDQGDRLLSGCYGYRMVGPDNRTVPDPEQNVVRLWDVKTGRELRCFKGHDSPVQDVLATPDDRLAISCAGDKTVRFWELPKAALNVPGKRKP